MHVINSHYVITTMRYGHENSKFDTEWYIINGVKHHLNSILSKDGILSGIRRYHIQEAILSNKAALYSSLNMLIQQWHPLIQNGSRSYLELRQNASKYLACL